VGSSIDESSLFLHLTDIAPPSARNGWLKDNAKPCSALTRKRTAMKLSRSIAQPIRKPGTFEERWGSEEAGLITCWERGREIRIADPSIAAKADEGQLVVLPWKGGVEKALKSKSTKKFGTLYYLAMWQGLRAEDLSIDTGEEVVLKCSVTGQDVIFTDDADKYREP
jgi:hypothetical protein